jgi:hypothetical protein
VGHRAGRSGETERVGKRHVFDLTNPIQNAAFLHLVQHHGYPTPLLDWTYSPFVAAYFAYQRVKSSEAASASEDQKVRIFVFDKVQWCVDLPQISNLSTRWEHFSIVEPVAIANERLIPQQALSSFTTVDDIPYKGAGRKALPPSNRPSFTRARSRNP